MKKLKILFLSLILSCATVSESDLKITIDLNLENFKKHLELKGRDVSLDFIFIPKEGQPKTFSTSKKLSKDEYSFLEENIKNLDWERVKERYISKDAIMMHAKPLLIQISYAGKSKNLIVMGDVPKDLNFLFKVMDPYLQIDFSMLK